MLVERLEVGDLGRRVLQARVGAAQALRERAGSSATAKKPKTLSADGELRRASDGSGSDSAAASAREGAGAGSTATSTSPT